MSSSRALQFLAVLGHLTLVTLGSLSYLLLLYVICFTRFYWLALVYLGYVIGDRGVSSRGGRPSKLFRESPFWRFYRDYFPIKLVKTVDLDPANNYLLCCFPHGFITAGAWVNFGSEATGVSSVFPGLDIRMITLGQFLAIPVLRELMLRQGMCASSKESLNYLLDPGRGGGRAAALIVGGAAEALRSRPGCYSIVLGRRKGFVRLALQNGAPLVPVFSFGESDIYQRVTDLEDGWVQRWLGSFDKYQSSSPSFMLSIFLFLYCYGILPQRRPITTVVGKPIPVDRQPEPSEEQVDALHATFREALVALFEEHKHLYVEDPAHAVLHIE